MNEDGRSRLTVIDQQMKLELIAARRAGRAASHEISRSIAAARSLAFSAESAQSPRDVYVYDLSQELARALDAQRGRPCRQQHVRAGGADSLPDVGSRGGKQRMLSGSLYTPKTPGPHPVLISIHGGPEEQYRPGYEAFFQFLVNELGYAVIAPNVRGSSGYGKTFLKLDNGVLREDSVKDIGSLLVWVGVQPMLDRDRVVVMGGSYGGYMSLATLVSYSDRLRGGIDVVGISNFNTFLKQHLAVSAGPATGGVRRRA